jgi:hypothetical protein
MSIESLLFFFSSCDQALWLFDQLLSIAELEALDEEDAYLAQAVFEHMQLNDTEVYFFLEYAGGICFIKH